MQLIEVMTDPYTWAAGKCALCGHLFFLEKRLCGIPVCTKEGKTYVCDECFIHDTQIVPITDPVSDINIGYGIQGVLPYYIFREHVFHSWGYFACSLKKS